MDQSLTKTKCPKCQHVNPAIHIYCSQCRTLLPRVQLHVAAESPPPSPLGQQVTLRPGSLFASRYKILGVIGRGGMGCIYRVHDNILHEDVALKTLLPQFVKDKMVVERFRNEARIARQLSHPNIVRVHDIGFFDAMLYISMEYVRGQSLRGKMDLLPPGQRLPIKTTLRVMNDLCIALEYAHQFTVHRDLKPENVMITEDGVVKLMDFGISKLMTSPQMTATSVVMGTPSYMSPEQLRDSSAVDARADIFSLGVMLYEIATGSLPVGIPKPASQVIREIPPALDPIVAKCVEPDPNNRYTSVAELRETLLPILELVESGSDMHGAAAIKKPWLDSESRRKLTGALLISVVLVVCGVGIFGFEKQRRLDTIEASNPVAVTEPRDSGSTEDIAGHVKRLEQLLKKAKALASGRSGVKPAIQEVIALGDLKWENAMQLPNDEAQGVRLRMDALECFLTPLLQEEYDGMVFIPSGVIAPRDETSAQSTPIGGYFIDAQEVTVGDYMAFVESVEGGWRLPPSDSYDAMNPGAPITGITFYDAMAYAVWAGKELPTEAQWARAAYFPYTSYAMYRSSQSAPQGDTAGTDDSASNGAVDEDREEELAESGCEDMAGSVSEWTRTSASGDDSDIAELDFGASLIVRGGGECINQVGLSIANAAPYGMKSLCIGFRCVKTFSMSVDEIASFLDGN